MVSSSPNTNLLKSGQILASALELSLSMVERGTVVLAIEKEIIRFLSSCKAQPSFYGLDGYKFASCISVNEQVVHAEPSKRVLNVGDIVTIDIGVRYRGWCTDAARTVVVGGPTSKTHLFLSTVSRALDAGASKAVSGNRVGDISFAIQRVVELSGLKSPLELGGHGIGTKPHMKPFIPNYGRRGTGAVIKEGMCLAIEPIVMGRNNRIVFGTTAVYSESGDISAHAEDTVFVTTSGPIILTRETLKGDIV